MSLTNEQYDSILKSYKDTRSSNERIIEERLDYVRENVSGYQELEDELMDFALAQTRLMLSNKEAAADTESVVQGITARKKELLVKAGLGEDYLEPIYTCNKCKDTGYIGQDKCSCFKRKISALLYEQSNLGAIFEGANFGLLSYDYYRDEDLEHFKIAVEDAKSFIRDFDDRYENILFYGGVGVGKSFLSACIAKELIDTDHQVVYFSAPGLFDVLSDIMFKRGQAQALGAVKEVIYSAELLIIDDLGTELYNSATATQLFSILNDRHLQHKATIISTNFDFNQLRERYDDRIFSRLLEMYSFKKLTGPDIRRLKRTGK